MIRLSLLLVVVGIPLACATGCQGSATDAGAQASANHDHEHGNGHDHDHGEVPKTFSEAVEKLVALRDKIRDGFAKDDVEAAHGPLHDVGHLLEDLTKLAEKHTPAVDLAAVKKDADELFDLFGKVDEKLHGEEGATYKDVSDKIDAAVERLHELLHAEPAGEAAS